MTTTHAAPTIYVLPPGGVSDDVAEAILSGTIAAEAHVAVLDVSGPAVATCLQGLLTNDIDAAGDEGFLYGAVLTNKGMIVCDMWTARGSGSAWLSVPAQGKEALLDVFKRYLPPRLAKVTDRSDELCVLRIAGPKASEVAQRAGVAVPEPGVSASAVVAGVACLVSRPTPSADFDLQIQLDRDRVWTVLESLDANGAVVTEPNALELARILAGWPRLGAEIDERTLPQEVRFDEIDGVSYTKGCYTGQETVARLHFRGHANRELRGLVWDQSPNVSDSAIVQNEKRVGRVTSIAWLGPFEQHVGLGIVHRNVDRERAVSAAGAPAGIVDLPFELSS